MSSSRSSRTQVRSFGDVGAVGRQFHHLTSSINASPFYTTSCRHHAAVAAVSDFLMKMNALLKLNVGNRGLAVELKRNVPSIWREREMCTRGLREEKGWDADTQAVRTPAIQSTMEAKEIKEMCFEVAKRSLTTTGCWWLFRKPRLLCSK